MVSLSLIGRYSSDKIYKFEQVEVILNETQSALLKLRQSERSFTTTLNKESILTFTKRLAQLRIKIDALDNALLEAAIKNADIALLFTTLKNYEALFHQLKEHQKQIGFNPTDGLYGKLRGAVHQAEATISNLQNDELLVAMLQLRRNEKDFMLRLNPKYIQQFNENIFLFNQQLKIYNYPVDVEKQIYDDINQYQMFFTQLTDANIEKGLAIGLGVQGQLDQSAKTVEKVLADIAVELHQVIASEIGSIATFQSNMAIIETILMIGFIAFFIWLARSVLTPIHLLSSTMVKAAKTKDLSLRINTKGQDEMSKACDALNNMLISFQDINTRIGTASGEVANATQRVSDIANRSNSSVHEQQQQTMQLSVVIEQMTHSISSVVNSASEAEISANNAHIYCQNGQQLINETVSDMSGLSQQVHVAAELIKQLQENEENIGDVLETIRSVAEQTNLLALNAAIEAARAGELGRGFAVVADEVRLLASRTQTATQEIQTMFNSFQHLSADAVKEMNLSLEQTNACMEAANIVGNSITDISNAVTQMSQMNAQITLATEEQSTVCHSVNMTITEINDIAKINAANSEESAETSQGLASLAKELQSIGAIFTPKIQRTTQH